MSSIVSKKHLLSATIVAAVAITVFAVFRFFPSPIITSSQNEKNRQSLLRIYGDVQPGIGIKQAWDAYSRHRTEALSIKVSDLGSWYIATPLEWGAGNWTLLVENSNQTVRAVRIRTMDGPAPDGAPPDKF